jgi:hypothetical protein
VNSPNIIFAVLAKTQIVMILQYCWIGYSYEMDTNSVLVGVSVSANKRRGRFLSWS